MKGKQISEEQRRKVLELKAAGKTDAEIAEELGISRATVYRVTSDTSSPGKQPGIDAGEGVTFLDTEARLLALLKSYGIKEADRIVAYVSSVGENTYTDLEALRRALAEQGVAAGKQLPIVRHWAAQERLIVPQTLAAEIETAAQTSQPKPQKEQKWIILGNKPVPETDGPYTFNQALQVIESQNRGQTQPQSGNNELTNLLISRLDKSDQRVESLLEQMTDRRFDTLASQISLIASDKKEAGRYDILGKAIDKIDGGLNRLGSDVRMGAQMMAAKGMPAPKPRTPEEKKRFAEGLTKGFENALKLKQLEDHLVFQAEAPEWLTGTQEVKPRPPIPPPPPQRYE